MSFPLPPSSHPARELMGDIAALAETLNPENIARLPTIWQARKSALRMFSSDSTGAMRRVAIIVIRADSDERWLVTFGRRGGWRKEWNFGTGRL
jgi:hypothetical protein